MQTFSVRYPTFESFKSNYFKEEQILHSPLFFSPCSLEGCRYCPHVDQYLFYYIDADIPSIRIPGSSMDYMRQAPAIYSDSKTLKINPFFCPAMDRLVSNHFGLLEADYTHFFDYIQKKKSFFTPFPLYSAFIDRFNTYLMLCELDMAELMVTYEEIFDKARLYTTEAQLRGSYLELDQYSSYIFDI